MKIIEHRRHSIRVKPSKHISHEGVNLARKVGVRRETIHFIEKGNYNPSLKLAHKIAKVLQTTIDDLFLFEDI